MAQDGSFLAHECAGVGLQHHPACLRPQVKSYTDGHTAVERPLNLA